MREGQTAVSGWAAVTSSMRAYAGARALTWAGASWLVVALGALLRLERLLDNRSFWLDEALLGLNLLEKSFGGLLGTLDYTQSAPAGFLLAEKVSLDLFGESELVLRLLPFLASVVALVVFRQVAHALLAPPAALLATVLFAVNEPLLYQSSEAKPYSTDVAVSLLLVWLYLRTTPRAGERLTVGALAPLAVAGTVAVWFSYPAAFVLAGIFVALLVRPQEPLTARTLWPLVTAGAVWAVSFLLSYELASQNISTVSGAIFAGSQSGTTRARELASTGWWSLSDPGGFLDSTRGVAALALGFGLLAFVRRRRIPTVMLLAVPGVLAVVAAAIEKYPLGGRFSLFLVPLMLILVAAGVHELTRISAQPLLVAGALVVLLAAPPVARAARHVLNPPVREQVRPLLVHLVHDWRDGDTLYVYRNAQYALRFYGECGDCGVPRLPFALRDAAQGTLVRGFPAALASSPPVVVGGDRGGAGEDLADLDALRGRPRVWLFISHAAHPAGLDEQQLFREYADKIGRRLDTREEPGAALYLYSFERQPGP
jgi:Dolichyl-phosphate-mannose-protein mannosyltransferase